MNPSPQTPITQRSIVIRSFRWLASKRGLRRMTIILVWFITIVGLFHAVTAHIGRRHWTEYRRELEERGERLDLRSYIPPSIPDSENFAATPIVQSWFAKTSTPQGNPPFEEAQTRVAQRSTEKGRRHFIDLNAWQKAFGAISNRAETWGQTFEMQQEDLESRAQAAPVILAALKSDDALFAEIREASRRPRARYPVNYKLEDPFGTLLPHLGHISGIIYRLELKASAELTTGQSDAALDDIRLMAYLCDSLEGEPFLIPMIVRESRMQQATQPVWEGLAEGRWSDAQLQELQKIFQGRDFVKPLNPALGSELASGIQVINLMREKGIAYMNTLGESEPHPPPLAGRVLGRIIVPNAWFYREEINYCRLFYLLRGSGIDETNKRISTVQIEAGNKAFERETTAKGQGLNKLLSGQVFASMLLPAIGGVSVKAAIAQTTTDQAALACALERYRRANKEFPEKLEALVPEFVSELPHDVLTGESYKYRRTADGQFVLYSIGWDQKDDGGNPGKLRFDKKNGDWVWQYPAK